LNAGLGQRASEANLFIRTREGENLGGASMITQNNDQDLTVPVRLVSIDQFIPLSRNISIIQLDVEGYEKQALSGALHTILRNKPLIIMEDNNGITNTAWFEKNILSLGYTPLGKVHNNHIFRW
jgi:FkbM family methyltransferase